MQAQQVHYTSCRNGTSGYSGFQIRATSQDVDPRDLQEVVQRCNYRRPYGQPIDDINAYPLACRSYRLSSGRLALTRVRYVGTDYSGREGNFFAHTLIVPESAQEQRPADYFFWKGWKGQLEDSEDLPSPPVLTDIPLSDLNCQLVFNRAEFNRFLQQGNNRRLRLRNMVKAVLLSLSDSRTLIVRGDSADVHWWIAAIQHCFPAAIANTMDSSTYEFAPQRLPLLSATVIGSEIVLDPMQRDYQHYVFDELEGTDSTVSSDAKWQAEAVYAQLATYLLLDAPSQEQADFFRFLDDLGHRMLSPDLGFAAWIYGLPFADVAAPNPAQLRGMLAYGLTVPADSLGWPLLVGRLEGKLRDWAHSPGDHALRVQFLAAAALAMPQAERYAALCGAWRDMLLEDLLAGNLPSTDFDNAGSYALRVLPGGNADLMQALIVPESIRRLAGILRTATPDLARHVLDKVDKALATLGRADSLQQAEIQALLAALEDNPQAFKEIIPAKLKLAATPTVFVELCRSAGLREGEPDAKIRELANLLAAQLADRKESFAQAVRQELPMNVLVKEWECLIDQAQNPLDVFKGHRDKLLATRSQLSFDDYAAIILKLLARLEDAGKLTLATDLLQSGDLYRLHRINDAHAKQLIQLLNSRVSLSLDDDIDDSVNYRLLAVASNLNIDLSPNRVKIRRLLTDAADAEVTFPEAELSNLSNDIRCLVKKEYRYVCDFLLNSCTAEERFGTIDHGLLVQNLLGSNINDFGDLYSQWLDKALNKNSRKALVGYARFWIWRDANTPSGKFPDSIVESVMRLLANKIANIKEESTLWNELAATPGRTASEIEASKPDVVKTRISALKNLVMEAEKTPLQRMSDTLTKWFGGGGDKQSTKGKKDG